MPYPLSASRLQSYHRCPQSYYFQYERGLKSAAVFGTASLGTALHQALAKIYWNWSYQEPVMPWNWVAHCWQEVSASLPPQQVQDGSQMLELYYEQYLVPNFPLKKPLAVEGKIQAHLQVEQLEFSVTGRYDRLDWGEEGLSLVDYKSAKAPQIPAPGELDVQLGLYYLALEQRYQQSLQQLSLLFLRTGETVTYPVTPDHKARVLEMIEDLASRLQRDQEWQPQTGTHCRRCAYRRYCFAVNPEAEPLPDNIKGVCGSTRHLQLSLRF